MTGTSTRQGGYREPRLLRCGIRNAGEKDPRAAPRTFTFGEPVGGDGTVPGTEPAAPVTGPLHCAGLRAGVVQARSSGVSPRQTGVVPRANTARPQFKGGMAVFLYATACGWSSSILREGARQSTSCVCRWRSRTCPHHYSEPAIRPAHSPCRAAQPSSPRHGNTAQSAAPEPHRDPVPGRCAQASRVPFHVIDRLSISRCLVPPIQPLRRFPDDYHHNHDDHDD